MAELLSYPVGAAATLRAAAKVPEGRILDLLKEMSFQDRAELVEWLLATNPDHPIRPRTDSERLAYANGMAEAINMMDDHGMKMARSELKLIVESEEWLAKRKAQNGK